MPDPTVKMVFAADAQAAERAFVGLERKVEGLEQKLKRTSQQKLDVGADKMTESLVSASAKVTGMVGGVELVRKALSGVADEAQRFNTELDTTINKIRESQTKLAVQNNLSDDDLKRQMPVIGAAAFRMPALDLPGAIEAQREISSVNVRKEDIDSGAALNAILDLRALSNAYGDEAEPVKKTAGSITKFLAATGGGTSASDMRRVGEKIAALSADSAIQAGDLEQLSQASGTLTQFGVNEDEQLAGFRVAYESQGPAVGATGFRNVMSRLGTAGGDKGRTEALAAIGLTPESVAVAKGGVSMGDALQTLRGATQGIDESKKNLVLKDLFGEEGMTTAGLLMSDTGFARYQQGLDAAQNAAGAAQTRLDRFSNSREATLRRADIETQINQSNFAMKEGLTWGEYERLEAARKTGVITGADGQMGRAFGHYVNWAEGIGDWLHKSAGFTPQGMGGVNSNLLEASKEQFSRESQRRMQEEQNRLMEQNNRLLEQIANGRILNRNAGRE